MYLLVTPMIRKGLPTTEDFALVGHQDYMGNRLTHVHMDNCFVVTSCKLGKY